MASVAERLMEQYPEFLFLLHHREIGPLLARAVDADTPLSPLRFQAELAKTKWYRSQSASQRRWQILAHMDPGEAHKQRYFLDQQIRLKAAQLGVSPTKAEISAIVSKALVQGLSAEDFWVTDALVRLVDKGGRTDVGAYTTTALQLKATALGQYFWAMPNHVAKKWTKWIIAGVKKPEDFQAALQAEAYKRMPWMKGSLAMGQTPADIVRENAEVWADEFGTSPEKVLATLTQHAGTPIRQITGIRDPKTNQTRLPTPEEVSRLARSQPEWWNTSKGRAEDARMAKQILEIFGKRSAA